MLCFRLYGLVIMQYPAFESGFEPITIERRYVRLVTRRDNHGPASPIFTVLQTKILWVGFMDPIRNVSLG